jgi:mannose-1-phosphate guanylyltransferase
MQAIILAGGKGTRLRPLTLRVPKPVVPLMNRPLISYQLDLLASVDMAEVTLGLSYQPDRIRAVLEREASGFTVNYTVEEEPLGTGGAVRYASKPSEGTVIVFNGDIISDLNLGAVLDFHRNSGAGVTIVLTEVEDPTNYGLVETGADDRVRQFIEKPGWNEINCRTINAGTYVIEPEYLELMEEGVHLSIEREFFPLLVEKKSPFFAYVHRGYWADIGTVASYLKAHSDFFRRDEPVPGDYHQAGPMIWAAEGAEVHRDSKAHGPVIVGPGSRIGEGVVFDRFSVVGRECSIEEGAHLDSCVLWDKVAVGRNTRLKTCVLGEESRLGENIRLSGLFALGSGGYIPDYSHHTEMHESFDPGA